MAAQPADIANLEQLAQSFDHQHYAVSLVTTGLPYLAVTNRATPRLTERIHAHDGCYWWSWAERICPVHDVPQAATKIANVLRTAG